MGGKFAVEMIAAWIERRREKKRKKRAAAEAAGVEGSFQYDEGVAMDAIKGGLKSKLVWLGIAQLAYSIFELWANGGLNAESASTAVSGALTIILRAVTTQSLAEKIAGKLGQ